MSFRVRRRLRARLALVWTMLAALAGNILVGTWFHSAPWRNDPPFARRIEALKTRLQARAAAGSLVLMVGSSRTMYAFDARLIEARLEKGLKAPLNVHNFGMLGAGPTMEFVIVKRLLEAGIRPDCLLIEVSPCFLNGRGETVPERGWIDPRRLLPREEEAVVPHGWLPAARTPWDRLAPAWFECREQIMRTARGGWLPPDTMPSYPLDAWGHFADSWDANDLDRRRNALEKSRERFKPLLDDWAPDGPAVAMLRLLLEFCRRDGLRVALVMLPEGPAAQSWYADQAKARVRQFLDHFPAQEGIPLVDAWNWLDEADFSDSHHQTSDGAAKFSARLARDFLIPWQRGSGGPDSQSPFVTTSSPRTRIKPRD
jgi:hypothetical protein